ncbi:MAG: hypothetical protein BZ151_11280 [Desulfobacca sp. 4484_104]|nr:MAG: hypothetical protein BZ151_11280 [Desulfobacca sp. 4484_104]RLA88061.1 MAG: hypothetical protein DRG58_09120 [Deltaproteobacteria bacterium]
MVKEKLIFLTLMLSLTITGCVGLVDRHQEEIVYENGKLQKFSYYNETYGGSGPNSAVFLDAIDIIRRSDSGAMPELKDLPQPKKRRRIPRSYVGIIKNCTKHEIFIPSQNSQGILTVPPQGWIEFIVWSESFALTAYVDGKPYRCFKIKVHPGEYPFMCQDYDFMAIIGPKAPPGVEGLG